MIKKALISGIAGQDGSYLAEHLLSLGYEVHGIIRYSSLGDRARLWRIRNILDQLYLHYADINNYQSIYKVFQLVKPDECYHLAAQSFVKVSFEDEFSTMGTNVNGTHYILSALKDICPECKFYFAASSEMFGQAEITPQNEKTKFHPRSIYGISKVAGYEITRHYREAYNIFACSGILFNHESSRRSTDFVTRKITNTAAMIKAGHARKIRLGNIEAMRDWGYAKDYVVAMYNMMQHDTPDDFVIASGVSHSVRKFLDLTFKMMGLNYENYLEIDKNFFRPTDVNALVGDSHKAKSILGWENKTSFEELVQIMVESDWAQENSTKQDYFI